MYTTVHVYAVRVVSKSTKRNIRLWNDGIVQDPDMPDSVVKKIKMLVKLATGIQKLLCVVASTLERAHNALAWGDPVVTTVLVGIICGVAFCLSVSVVIFRLLFSFVQLHWIVALAGAATVLRPLFRQSEGLQPAQQAGGQTETPTQRSTTTPLDTLTQRLRNIFARIPDEAELEHRRIAKMQVCLTQSLVHSVNAGESQRRVQCRVVGAACGLGRHTIHNLIISIRICVRHSTMHITPPPDCRRNEQLLYRHGLEINRKTTKALIPLRHRCIQRVIV